MLIIACMSLSGGQGKTTTAVQLARYLAQRGHSVLTIDADPQANLTTFLGHTVAADEPTLLEVIKGVVKVSDAVYGTPQENLGLIPADDGLDTVVDYLSNSGVGAMLLGTRLEDAPEFDVCLIDSPPQRSQMCKTIIGAAQQVLIPCEASVKGFGSLTRTLDAIQELKDVKASKAQILGVIPFRDRWVGAHQTSQSKDAIAAMVDEVGQDAMIPTIRESERYKQAITQFKTLHELGFTDLGYPFEVLADKIGGLIDD